MPVTSLRAGHGAVSLSDAVARFLDRYRDEPVIGLAIGAAVFVFVDRYPRLPRSR